MRPAGGTLESNRAEIISGLQSRQLKDFRVLDRLVTPFHTIYFSKLNSSAKKRFLAILIATLTAACSAILPNEQNTAALVATSIDYRKIISEGTPAPMVKGAQVSELRKTSGPQLGDWMACVKSDTTPYIGFFAVFIEDGKVKDFRRSIGIDRCEVAMYSPLPPATPPAQEKDKPRKHKKADSTLRPSNNAN